MIKDREVLKYILDRPHDDPELYKNDKNSPICDLLPSNFIKYYTCGPTVDNQDLLREDEK